MKKRLIIAGMGSIGLRHARLYAGLPNLAVEVCDPRAEGLQEAAAQVPGAKGWLDFEQALASQPDYLLVATPHHLHADMACAALERRIPVLCEKPMSHRLDEAEKMARTAERCGVPLAVGFHLRFHPSVCRLRGMLASGEAGELLFARYCVDSLVTLENSRSRYQAHLPGALLMDYSHGLDLLLRLVDQTPSWMSARGAAGSIAGFQANPLLVSGILGYPDGFQSELHLSYTGKPEVHKLELVTSQGNLSLELNGGKFQHSRITDGVTEDLSAEYERDALYLAQWEAFLGFCEGKDSGICTFGDALKVSRLMNDLLEEIGAAHHDPAFA